MFVLSLLNVLPDLTDEFDLFCRSFAIQNTSASLYSILTYQMKFPLPHPQLLNFQFSNTHDGTKHVPLFFAAYFC